MYVTMKRCQATIAFIVFSFIAYFSDEDDGYDGDGGDNIDDVIDVNMLIMEMMLMFHLRASHSGPGSTGKTELVLEILWSISLVVMGSWK